MGVEGASLEVGCCWVEMENWELPVGRRVESCPCDRRSRAGGGLSPGVQKTRTHRALGLEGRVGDGEGGGPSNTASLLTIFPQPWRPLSASTWTRTSRQSSPLTALGSDTAWPSTPTPGEDPVGTSCGYRHLLSLHRVQSLPLFQVFLSEVPESWTEHRYCCFDNHS